MHFLAIGQPAERWDYRGRRVGPQSGHVRGRVRTRRIRRWPTGPVSHSWDSIFGISPSRNWSAERERPRQDSNLSACGGGAPEGDCLSGQTV